jgi:hypothetical protein
MSKKTKKAAKKAAKQQAREATQVAAQIAALEANVEQDTETAEQVFATALTTEDGTFAADFSDVIETSVTVAGLIRQTNDARMAVTEQCAELAETLRPFISEIGDATVTINGKQHLVGTHAMHATMREQAKDLDESWTKEAQSNSAKFGTRKGERLPQGNLDNVWRTFCNGCPRNLWIGDDETYSNYRERVSDALKAEKRDGMTQSQKDLVDAKASAIESLEVAIIAVRKATDTIEVNSLQGIVASGVAAMEAGEMTDTLSLFHNARRTAVTAKAS